MFWLRKKGIQTSAGKITPIQILILLKLTKEPAHGYDILKELDNEFAGLWKLKSGTLYPALHKLKEKGLIAEKGKIAQEDVPDKLLYEITEKGEKVLEEVFQEDRFMDEFEEEIAFQSHYWEHLGKEIGKFTKYTVKSAMQTAIESLRSALKTSFPEHLYKRHEEEEKDYLDSLKKRKTLLKKEIEKLERKIDKLSFKIDESKLVKIEVEEEAREEVEEAEKEVENDG
ncbi:MAG: PadR family transcriptional regulator [Candidatus Wukongarchaeota archaeon]|nr:PadR family transcriptional regulator [Candidatus Wukongarchaeota archaeon]MDO8128872.1 PadR family transcriptional regulator [Candidatus Wukongarchaeota archaeon]